MVVSFPDLQTSLVPRPTLERSVQRVYTCGVETAHVVGMDYQEDPYREARPEVAISSQKVPSVCES